MQPNFQEFPYRTTRGGEPAISFQSRGAATVNPAAVKALGAPDEIMLLFDEDKHILGIRAVKKGTKGAYPLRPLSKADSSTRSFAVRGLLRYYGINFEGVTRRYRAHVLDEKTLAVDLREEPMFVKENPNMRKAKEGEPIE